MLKFIIEIILWCFCIYGIMSLILDIFCKSTYKKINNNINMILTVNNVEDEIENYIRTLQFDNSIFYNNLVIIDLDSSDKTFDILSKFEKTNNNIKILNKDNGINYLKGNFNIF